MIYEIPTLGHDSVAMEFCTRVAFALGNRYDDFRGTGGARYTTSTSSSREGDGGFLPRNKISQVPGQRPWPNIVIEVNYSRPLNDLVNKINNFWLSDETTVQQVVAIVIGYPDAIAGVRSLIVYNFLRNGATTIDLAPQFDISYPPMLNAGDVAFQFPVRLQDMYFDDGINFPITHTLNLPDPLLVDLYWIQRACAECLPVTPVVAPMIPAAAPVAGTVVPGANNTANVPAAAAQVVQGNMMGGATRPNRTTRNPNPQY
jgi:hypothetical protein